MWDSLARASGLYGLELSIAIARMTAFMTYPTTADGLQMGATAAVVGLDF